MKVLLFLTLAAFTAHGVDKDETMFIVLKDNDRIEYEDIIDIIFWDEIGEFSIIDCVSKSPSPEPEPEPKKD